MKHPLFTETYLRENIMGPNPIRILEEMLSLFSIPEKSVILDLGCGRGLTSMYLAKETKSTVFATDLWIPAGENLARFSEMGFTQTEIVPIHAEAHELPYAEGFFDAVVSIDSFHYFGYNPDYLRDSLLPFVRKGGLILLAVPGLKRDFDGQIPPEMLHSWTPEDLDTMHDCAHWRDMLSHAPQAEILTITELCCFEQAWAEWLACDQNPHAVGDRASMNAGAGNYMNLIGIVLQKR
ncbi:MAG: SAM-dependent methyltransferase [Candidatus Merdivicinus sp.]|jgi:cyclopropane fatty-acyl-phospholipid synthase-like methyltransferase